MHAHQATCDIYSTLPSLQSVRGCKPPMGVSLQVAAPVASGQLSCAALETFSPQHMALSTNWRVLVLGVHIKRALPLAVCFRASDFCKLPYCKAVSTFAHTHAETYTARGAWSQTLRHLRVGGISRDRRIDTKAPAVCSRDFARIQA